MSPDFRTLSDLCLSLSWFEEDRDLLGRPARALSLASREAVRVMGLRILEPDPAYGSVEAEIVDLYAYAWLHTAPLDEVCDALWSGGWRAVLDPPAEALASTAAVVPEWRERRLRLAATVAAVEYSVRARPRSGSSSSAGDDTPSDIIEPTRLAFRLRLLMRDTHATRHEALWEWPYVQALQITQAAQRWEGQWTVPPVERSGPVDFEAFEIPAEEEV